MRKVTVLIQGERAAGKTTIAAILARALRWHGVEAKYTTSPTARSSWSRMFENLVRQPSEKMLEPIEVTIIEDISDNVTGDLERRVTESDADYIERLLLIARSK